MTRLQIDKDKCEGHGRCYDIAPNLFESDDYGHGQLIDGVTAADADEQEAMRAVHACPELAVIFEP